MNEEELKELAAQLRHPAGEMGIKVAHNMNPSGHSIAEKAQAALTRRRYYCCYSPVTWIDRANTQHGRFQHDRRA